MFLIKIILLNLLFVIGFLLLLPSSPWLFSSITLLILIVAVLQLQQEKQQQRLMLQSLLDGLRNLQDGDFAISLSENVQQKKDPQQHQLISVFNQVTDKLRQEKQSLYQRELLLDKVVNASDVVTVLVNHRNTIIFANRAALQFFHQHTLLGHSWSALVKQKAPELQQHHDKSNAIIQLTIDDSEEQSWHLSRHQLKLHGSSHQLWLLKPITKELNQQELETWKKVIRVINHELNNSIAPISSMCHSGKILANRIDEPQLNLVFDTITGRVKKLSDFIQNYSQLARLSSPIKSPFNLRNTFEQLQSLYPLTLEAQSTELLINADESQIEQLLINLLKNAKQASPDMPTEVSLQKIENAFSLIIRDFGKGMSSSVMQKAFLPYFSTKVEGSGIGLSLCREVVEAHQGKISLSNHEEGGLQVSIILPYI
jgi:two-component system nitrogen regulation sensor histidine kinase NtrY